MLLQVRLWALALPWDSLNLAHTPVYSPMVKISPTRKPSDYAISFLLGLSLMKEVNFDFFFVFVFIIYL